MARSRVRVVGGEWSGDDLRMRRESQADLKIVTERDIHPPLAWVDATTIMPKMMSMLVVLVAVLLCHLQVSTAIEGSGEWSS